MKIKVSFQKLRVKMLDNEILKKVYGDRIKHFARIMFTNGGKEYKTVITEKLMYFQEYISRKT